ncbi:MAG: hypothetical protein OD918_03205 [Gammaproteobacteria bacterium]
MKHKTKSLLKLATALLFCVTAPLHAADTRFHPGDSLQKLGFTETNKGLPLIPSKDLLPDAAGGGAVTFSLDLYFGTNTQPVYSIIPLIHYNSKKIEVILISNIVGSGHINPLPHKEDQKEDEKNPDYTPELPLPAITVGGKPVASDADRVMLLSWQAGNKFDKVAKATTTAMMRIATITFRWKAGAIGNTHIGITQGEASNAHAFLAESITVRGPVAAEITTQRASIDVTAGKTQFRVQCASSRIFTTDATCVLALKSDAVAQALASIITPPIDGARIVIPKGATSGSLAFDIEPSTSDSGRMLSIALAAADAGGAPLSLHKTLAEIALMGPGLISESSIVTVEGETEKLSVQLATRPANGVVVVDVRSINTGEAALAPASLTFTASDWDEAQVVSVTSADDQFVDGDTPYTIKFAVNTGKTGAIHYHGITTYVHGTTADNDKAEPLLTAKPNKNLTVGDHQIVITAALTGGGVYAFDRKLVLRKAGGSAVEGTDYVPFALPQHIMIPAGMASAGATFTLTISKMDTAVKSIAIAVDFLGSKTGVPGIVLAIGAFDWDVDKSGNITAQDGIMTARYLLGVRGAALVDGQSSVAKHIKNGLGVLDVSGNDSTNGDDGILIARYFLGLRGAALVRGIAPRPEPNTVKTNIMQFLPPPRSR